MKRIARSSTVSKLSRRVRSLSERVIEVELALGSLQRIVSVGGRMVIQPAATPEALELAEEITC